MIDYLKIIHKYIPPDTPLYRNYIIHVTLTTAKALEIARRLGLDDASIEFVEEAAMLHDIGVCKVRSEHIGSKGEQPYIAHGHLGREILEAEGLPKHALVAERHNGVGITKAEIIAKNLPVPHRDMVPVTLEEKIIAYADNFYTKVPEYVFKPYSIPRIKDRLAYFNDDAPAIWQKWHEQFS